MNKHYFGCYNEVLQIKPTKENVDSTNVEQCVDLSVEDENINTEVVWLPASSPQKNLQQFLNFRKLVLEDENVAPSIFSDDESIVLPAQSDDEENIEPVHSIVRNEGDTIVTVSKMEFFKEWVKHSDMTGFEQDRRLFNCISSKLDLNSAIEPLEYIKNIISCNSFKISQMWIKSGKDQNVIFEKYATWFNSPPIEFTISAAVKTQTHKLLLFGGEQPPQNQTQQSIPKIELQLSPPKLLRMNLQKNTDVFKFLKRAKPPFRPDLLFTVLTSITHNLDNENKIKLEQFCNRYVADLKFKLLTANNDETVFKTKFGYWLQLTVRWPAFLKTILNSITKKPAKTNQQKVTKPTENPAANPLKWDIKTLEEALTNKCSEMNQQDISKVMHRLVHHPEDAARMTALIENSECSCCLNMTDKPVVISDSCKKNPEKDPLMTGHALHVDELGIDSTLTKDRSLLRKSPTEAHQTASKQTLDPDILILPVDKLNVVPSPTIQQSRANNLHQSELNQSEKSQENELRPVLEKLLFIKKLNVKSGTKVKLPHNKEGTIVDVSNVKNVAVIIPKSSIMGKAKVQTPQALKSDVRVQASQPDFKSGSNVNSSSNNINKVLNNEFLSDIKSGPAVQNLLADIEKFASIISRTTVHEIPSKNKIPFILKRHIRNDTGQLGNMQFKSRSAGAVLLSDIKNGKKQFSSTTSIKKST